MVSALKKKMFELLYREGDVHILISTTADGVRVPACVAASAKDKLIGFVLGMRPSPRLQIRESGLFAPLRFGDERFQCFFPWESVLQMNSRDCVVFFAKGEKEEGLRREGKKGRPKLTVVQKETTGR